jgi:hypothetical protein
VPGAEASQRVSIERRTPNRRPLAILVVALWAAFMVVLATVGPALAVVGGPTKLVNPSVSPRSGTTSTRIVFEVGYRNRAGTAPDHVDVVIDGVRHRMAATGTDWKLGVVMRWSSTLPAGSHGVRFEAEDTRRFTDGVGGGSVTIAKAAPTPAPTPKPTPTPTPTPTPRPAPGAGGSTGGGSTGLGSSTGGSGGSLDSPSAGGAGGPGGAGSWGGVVPGLGSGPDGAAAGSSRSDPTGAGESAGVGGETPGSQSGPRRPSGATIGVGSTDQIRIAGWGDLAHAFDVLGIRRSTTTTILPMLVGTTTATAMAFAFAIFGKKRRDEEPPAPDEVLQAQAARGISAVPGSEVVGVIRGPLAPALVDTEAAMPRWRRPSLMEARKADPSRFVATTARMSFDTGAVAAVEGRERRVIRYRVVRLLDAPDELRSVDIGQLDQGDEVQLLERSGAYWLVLCPDGRQGWLHKMTLGEIVTDDAPQSGNWTPEVDDDVLSAFLAARARA